MTIHIHNQDPTRSLLVRTTGNTYVLGVGAQVTLTSEEIVEERWLEEGVAPADAPSVDAPSVDAPSVDAPSVDAPPVEDAAPSSTEPAQPDFDDDVSMGYDR